MEPLRNLLKCLAGVIDHSSVLENDLDARVIRSWNSLSLYSKHYEIEVLVGADNIAEVKINRCPVVPTSVFANMLVIFIKHTAAYNGNRVRKAEG